MPESANDLKKIYQRRFESTAVYRNRVWSVLVVYLNRWLPSCETVLDLGCGYGEWINQIKAPHRHAMDLNSAARSHLDAGVVFHEQDCTKPWPLSANSLDAVITSNFFEHLPGKQSLRDTLCNAYVTLKPGGRLIAMGPNIRYLPGAYWDFFDHHLALTERSLSEVLELEGFEIDTAIPRFMPYTLVGGRQYPLFCVKAYLAQRWAWPILGRQFLVVARKPTTSTT